MPYITHEQLRILKEALNNATFEGANFNDDIRSFTESYRNTWIIGPIESVIREIEKKENKKTLKED